MSLYIHIPFCQHRCGYCDFNTYAGIQNLIPSYTQAVCNEIEYISATAGRDLPIHTIYFGGGTPSLLPAGDLKEILISIRHNFQLLTSSEITIEANPGTVSEEYFVQIHKLGVNRLSLGMQSANQDELVLLERQHSYEDVVKSVAWARNAGIDNLNLDLIFGLPGQPVKSWLKSLDAALSLQPEHLSLYALTLEHGTPMQHKVDIGILPKPDPDVAADMYEAASEKLEKAGYIQYEISNWSYCTNQQRTNFCQHNLQYWRNLPYIGVGAGAHGFIDHYRTVDITKPQDYINQMVNDHKLVTSIYAFPATPATVEINPIDFDAEIGETMMMGLRLVREGVVDQDFQQRFGVRLTERFPKQIERLISLGLLEWMELESRRLRLTKKGHLLGNQVFKEFI